VRRESGIAVAACPGTVLNRPGSAEIQAVIERAPRPSASHRWSVVLAATAVGALLTCDVARAVEQKTPYTVRARLLGGILRLELRGTLVERVDAHAGRFAIRATGQGTGIANAFESAGILRDGRWVPETTSLLLSVWGRTYRSELRHDPDARVARYRSVGESFFLRRPRLVEDTLVLEPGQRLDDIGSASLNYAERRWPSDPDGRFRTSVVRHGAGPERRPDGSRAYRARLSPLALEPHGTDERGRVTALVDLTGFSAWALPDRPMRIVFERDRRPARVSLRLLHGTSVEIEFGPGRPRTSGTP
jgi:hypothetical protein